MLGIGIVLLFLATYLLKQAISAFVLSRFQLLASGHGWQCANLRIDSLGRVFGEFKMTQLVLAQGNEIFIQRVLGLCRWRNEIRQCNQRRYRRVDLFDLAGRTILAPGKSPR